MGKLTPTEQLVETILLAGILITASILICTSAFVLGHIVATGLPHLIHTLTNLQVRHHLLWEAAR